MSKKIDGEAQMNESELRTGSAPTIFIIFGEQRSGTTALGGYLSCHEQVVVLPELFLTGEYRDADGFEAFLERQSSSASTDRTQNFHAYLKWITEKTATEYRNKVGLEPSAIGIHLKIDQAMNEPELVPYLISVGVTFIHIIREDLLGTAVSQYALNNKLIPAHTAERTNADFVIGDDDHLLYLVDEILSRRSEAERLLSGATIFHVTFEALFAGNFTTRTQVLESIVAFLGLPVGGRSYRIQTVPTIGGTVARRVKNFERLQKLVANRIARNGRSKLSPLVPLKDLRPQCPICRVKGLDDYETIMDRAGQYRTAYLCPRCGAIIPEWSIGVDNREAANRQLSWGPERLSGIDVPWTRGVMVECFEILARSIPGLPVRAGANVFEIGSDEGKVTDALKQIGCHVHANSINPRITQEARRLFGLSKEELSLGDASEKLKDIVAQTSLLDLVVAWHSLQYIAHPMRVLHEAKRALKPGGMILVQAAYFTPSYITYQSMFFLSNKTLEYIAKELGMRIIFKDNDFNARFLCFCLLKE